MSINISSRKAKGRSLQNKVRDIFRKIFEEKLENGDIESRPMGNCGTDLILSPQSKRLIPFDIEAKNQESLSIWSCLSQCEKNTEKGRIPLLVFKRNRSETYATLKLSDLLQLLYPEKNIPQILTEIKQNEKKETLE